MGAECCRLLQLLTDGQERWYARARDRLSAAHRAQSLPFDKPGLSFCCGSGTDKPIRLCLAKPALIDRPCLSQALFPFTAACGACSVPSEPRQLKSNDTERHQAFARGLLVVAVTVRDRIPPRALPASAGLSLSSL
jgi:hypothetical protein